jgi:cardiolipin synthase
MNIGQEHLDGGVGFDSWRDTQVRLMEKAQPFCNRYSWSTGTNAVRENLFYAKYFPGDAMDPAEGDVPVQILTSGPDSQWAAIRQLYAFMIVTAQRHVYLQSPFFIPDATIAEALRAAALSGVDVKVMVERATLGQQTSRLGGNTYIEEIVAAGVRVFLYEKGYLHAKTISIDSDICSIGSANIDIRSFSINYELNAVFFIASGSPKKLKTISSGTSNTAANSTRRLIGSVAPRAPTQGFGCKNSFSLIVTWCRPHF